MCASIRRYRMNCSPGPICDAGWIEMLALAWRNVLRHARRSALTMLAVALGLCALIFLWGFNDGVHNAMMRNLQEVIVGSLQIHRQGFFHHPRLSDELPNPARVHALLRQRGLDRYADRLRTFALAAGADVSEGLVLLGVHPALEMRVTRLAQKVAKGRFLRDNDEAACVLGRTTARNLGVSVGDSLVLLSEDRYGALAAERVRLVGIIDSGEMGIDRGLAIVPLGFLQRMLAMSGRISGVVLQLPRARLEQETMALRTALGDGYEVLRWYDMYPMMKQWVELEDGFYYIFLSIVLLIVAAGIMNTVLMSMLERIHEFGVMLALGCRPWRLAGMVVIEAMILGFAGVLLGACAGLLLVSYFHDAGIDLSHQMTTITRFYIEPVVRTEINTEHLVDTVCSVLLAAVLASVWPALRAMRLEPVEAIHHV
ncbi:MAG: ABC transporter permease [Zetaproteobacteria bacterium]|nr:MAG: ABC transporter permease [Zetaproteobacteria bacterium]